MNRQMNLPALTRIAMEFERENDIMDQRQEMMDDAIDETVGPEDEEEGEEVVKVDGKSMERAMMNHGC